MVKRERRSQEVQEKSRKLIVWQRNGSRPNKKRRRKRERKEKKKTKQKKCREINARNQKKLGFKAIHEGK